MTSRAPSTTPTWPPSGRGSRRPAWWCTVATTCGTWCPATACAIVGPAACRVPAMAALRAPDGRGPDALLVTDDGMRFWADGSWAIDRDLPLLVVNHATADE